MTIVGKILVFMNLIFSLVVGGFALVDYSSRTHWAKGFRDLEGKFKIISASAEAFKRESDDLRKEKTDLYDKLVAERVVIDPAAKDDRDSGFRIATSALNALRERTKSIDELKNQMESLRKQLTEEKAKATTLANMEQGFKTDAERHHAAQEEHDAPGVFGIPALHCRIHGEKRQRRQKISQRVALVEEPGDHSPPAR